MRIVKPLAARQGPNVMPLPRWHKEWLASKGRWVELQCGCIADINLPSAVAILTRKPEIECVILAHGFQRIKRSIRFTEVIARRLDITIPIDTDPEGLFPPF